jgi:hypothetical protein
VFMPLSRHEHKAARRYIRTALPSPSHCLCGIAGFVTSGLISPDRATEWQVMVSWGLPEKPVRIAS